MKDRIMEKMAKVKILDYTRPTKATGLTRSIYQRAENELGLAAEPLLIHSSDPEILEAFYTLGREVLLVRSHVQRTAKDAIATVVSHSNTCQYCVDSHSMSVGAEGDSALMTALEENDLTSIRQHPLYTTIAWFNTNNASVRPALSSIALAEYLAVFFYFHYTNRMVNTFVSASHIPTSRWAGLFKKIGAWYMSKYTSKPLKRGEYSNVPDSFDLAGTREEKTVQNRLSYMANLLDNRIKTVLSPRSIETVQHFIAHWDGEPVPMGRWWVENEIQHLDASERPLVRYILLFGLAGFTLSEEEVVELKEEIGSLHLLYLSSWGAFNVARRLTELKYHQYKKANDREILQQHVS